MLATILVPIPLIVSSIAHVPIATRDCNLEALTPAVSEARALSDFDARIRAYVALHRRLVRSTGVAMPDDEGEFFADDLRAAISAARPQARPGEFFTASVGQVIAARIDRALLRGLPLPSRRLYAPLPGEPGPAVNSRFPFVAGNLAWPALFIQLPELPPELGYAVWGRDLVLVDLAANLVLDVLPDALPEDAYLGVVYP
jgi:hypothetical protein